MNKEKTGEMIRSARTQQGLTQNELGALLGVTNKAISRWENGESFPDVGVLEQLSVTLNLELKAIITGEEEAGEHVAVTEIARVAKLQEAERKRRLQTLGLSGLLVLFLLLCGWNVFGGFREAREDFYFLMAIVLGVFSVKSVSDGRLGNPFRNKGSRLYTLISILTGIGMMAEYLLAAWLLCGGKTLFGMKVIYTGPCLNVQLMLVFLMNIVFLFRECGKVGMGEQDIHVGMYIEVFCVFLTLAYSRLLFNMVSLERFLQMMLEQTGFLLVESFLFLGLTVGVICIQRKNAQNR